MNNARTFGWMAIAIVLTVGAHLILDMRGSGVSKMTNRATISRSADVASAVSVKRVGEPTVVMSKASGEWRLLSPFKASADSQAILGLLDALAFVPVIDSMDESELRKIDRYRNDFGLQPPRIEVETLGPGGADKIFFGNPTPAGDGIYVAVEGESVIFVVATNVWAAVDRPAEWFRNRTLFGIGEDEIGAFDIKRRTGAFARFRRDGDKWRMSDPQSAAVSNSRMRKFISTLLGSQAAGFVWPVGASNETDTASASLLAGYGLDPDSAVTLTLKGVDGVDRQVSFGDDAEDGFVYAMAHNGGVVVKVDSSLKNIVLSAGDELIDNRLFPVEESAVAFVSISDGDEKCILAKNPDGSWRLDAPVSAAADSSSVMAFVSAMLALISADADESGVRVSLSPDVAPAMVPREKVFPVAGIEKFRSKEMIDIPPAQVRRLVVAEGGTNSVAVVYEASRKMWKVESSETGGVVDTAALDALLSSLNPMQALSVVKLRVNASELATYGLDSPSYTIAVDRVEEDSVRKNIRIGAIVEGGRYATIGSSDAVFVLPESTVRKLIAPIVR